MNIDERKLKVGKVIKDTLHRVIGGSIQDTTFNELVHEIDEIYRPYLNEIGDSN